MSSSSDGRRKMNCDVRCRIADLTRNVRTSEGNKQNSQNFIHETHYVWLWMLADGT